MAVLNIRVEDRIREQLKKLADAEGATLSEYVRDLIRRAQLHELKDAMDRSLAENMQTFDQSLLTLYRASQHESG